VSVASYIDQRCLEAIHRALDIPLLAPAVATSNGYRGYAAVNGDDEQEGEIVDEDVTAD